MKFYVSVIAYHLRTIAGVLSLAGCGLACGAVLIVAASGPVLR
jgi:hypothetical protein